MPRYQVTATPASQVTALSPGPTAGLNPNPSATVQAWPMQHPELTVLAWVAALIAMFALLSVRLYRRKSL